MTVSPAPLPPSGLPPGHDVDSLGKVDAAVIGLSPPGAATVIRAPP